MAIAEHLSREMLQLYSHIRQEARRKAVAAVDNDTITAQLERWQSPSATLGKRQLHGKKEEGMVGAEGFEPPTLCSQSRCATRLRYAPMTSLDCSAVWFTVGFETAMPVTPSGNRPNHSIQAEAAAGAG